MKKLIVLLIVFVFSFAVGLASPAIVSASGSFQAPPPLQLPDALVLLIQSIVTFLVFNGLKGLGEFFGIDFSPFVATVTAVIAGTVVFFFNAILASVPPGSTQDILAMVLQLLVLLVGGIAGATRVKNHTAFVQARAHFVKGA